jgi:hypothetical protein
MRNPRIVLVVAAIIVLPIVFGLLGGTRDAGLVIGIVLVVVGIVSGVLGARSPGDGDER